MTWRDPVPEVPPCPACGGEGGHASGPDRHHAPFIHVDCPSGVTLFNGSTVEWETWALVRERHQQRKERG